MNQFGYLGVLFLITIENIFPPIPSEIILPFSGFMTTISNMTVPGVVLVATIGSVVGAIILYLVGNLLNRERLKKIVLPRDMIVYPQEILDIPVMNPIKEKEVIENELFSIKECVEDVINIINNDNYYYLFLCKINKVH